MSIPVAPLQCSACGARRRGSGRGVGHVGAGGRVHACAGRRGRRRLGCGARARRRRLGRRARARACSRARARLCRRAVGRVCAAAAVLGRLPGCVRAPAHPALSRRRRSAAPHSTAGLGHPPSCGGARVWAKAAGMGCCAAFLFVRAWVAGQGRWAWPLECRELLREQCVWRVCATCPSRVSAPAQSSQAGASGTRLAQHGVCKGWVLQRRSTPSSGLLVFEQLQDQQSKDRKWIGHFQAYTLTGTHMFCTASPLFS